MTKDSLARDIDGKIQAFQDELLIFAERLTEFIKQKRQQPEKLKQELPFLLKQLDILAQNPTAYQHFAHIVSLLGAWPNRFAYSQIWLRYVEFALAISEVPQSIYSELLLLKLDVLCDVGKFDDVLELAEAYIHFAEVSDLGDLMAAISYRLVMVYLVKGLWEKAMLCCQNLAAHPLFLGSTNPERQINLALAFIQVYRQLQLHDELEALATKTAPLLKEICNLDVLALWHHHLGLSQWDATNYELAMRHYQKARESYAQLHDHNESGVISDMSLILWSAGRLIEAERLLEDVQPLLLKSLNYFQELKFAGNLALVYLSQGRLNEAYELNELALKNAQMLKHSLHISRLSGNKGILCLHLGRFSEAYSALEYDLANSYYGSLGHICALVNFARLQGIMGEGENAFSSAITALELAQKTKQSGIKIIALRVYAEWHPDKELALEAVESAYRLAKDIRLLDEAACLLTMAVLQKDDHARQSFWKRGKSLLIKIGGGTWLKRKNERADLSLPLI